MEDNNQEMYELYARLTVKKLEEIAVQGDARAHFYCPHEIDSMNLPVRPFLLVTLLLTLHRTHSFLEHYLHDFILLYSTISSSMLHLVLRLPLLVCLLFRTREGHY